MEIACNAVKRSREKERHYAKINNEYLLYFERQGVLIRKENNNRNFTQLCICWGIIVLKSLNSDRTELNIFGTRQM